MARFDALSLHAHTFLLLLTPPLLFINPPPPLPYTTLHLNSRGSTRLDSTPARNVTQTKSDHCFSYSSRLVGVGMQPSVPDQSSLHNILTYSKNSNVSISSHYNKHTHRKKPITSIQYSPHVLKYHNTEKIRKDGKHTHTRQQSWGACTPTPHHPYPYPTYPTHKEKNKRKKIKKKLTTTKLTKK